MKELLKFISPINEDSIICLCPLRNESHILETFLKHYKNHGVSHFVLFDNLSTDDTVEICYGLSDRYNISLYSCEQSFLESKWGSLWAVDFMNEHCINNWCITVDTDEFITPRNNKTVRDFILQLESENKNSCRTLLVDMYPKELLEKKGCSIEDSKYFDKFNKNFYNISLNEFGQRCVSGGLRKRIYDSDNLLSKCSLFKYDFYKSHTISGGWHWITPDCNFNNDYLNSIAFHPVHSSRFYDKDHHLSFVANSLRTVRDTSSYCAILHYKFLRKDIYSFFKERIARKQDWDDSQEYQKYIAHKCNNFYNKQYSVDSSSNKNSVYDQLIDLL